MSLTIQQSIFGPRYQKLRFWMGVLLYACIVVIGLIPGAREEMSHVGSKLTLHAVGYGVLSFFFFTGTAGDNLRKAWCTMTLIAVFGAFDEILQSLVPYRTASVDDWIVDCTTAILTSLLLYQFAPRFGVAPK